MVAVYTTYDAYGIRATADPFTFLAWFFMLDGIFIPVVTHRRWRQLPAAEIVPLLKRGVLGAFVAYFSFGSIMLATRLDKVGEAAVLRETSTVFAALIGWLVLGEKVGPVTGRADGADRPLAAHHACEQVADSAADDLADDELRRQDQRHRERNQPEDDEAGCLVLEACPIAQRTLQPVLCRGRGEEGQTHDGAGKRRDVDPLLGALDLLEARTEWQDDEEGHQHLRSRQEDAQFLQEVGEVLVAVRSFDVGGFRFQGLARHHATLRCVHDDSGNRRRFGGDQDVAAGRCNNSKELGGVQGLTPGCSRRRSVRFNRSSPHEQRHVVFNCPRKTDVRWISRDG